MQLNLRGVVLTKFPSATSFGKAIGWSGRKARDIVSGRQIPNAIDIERMADALGITDSDEFLKVFFPNIVH